MTNYIQNFLAESFEKSFDSYFGIDVINNIKKRLMEKHGINLSQALRTFSKFEDVLFEFFGEGSSGVIYHLLDDICKIKKQEGYGLTNTIEIKDDDLKYKILEAYNDLDKKCILIAAAKNPITINEMLELVNNTPSDKAKQKIHELVYSGLLAADTDEMLLDMTKKYSNIIDSVSIHMENNLLKISIRVKEELFKNPILKKYTSN